MYDDSRQKAAAQVFVDSIDGADEDSDGVVLACAEGTAIKLEDPDRHHLLDVLRLRPGELVRVCDGKGSVVDCIVTGKDLDDPLLLVDRPRYYQRPLPLITVAFSVLKRELNELIVQKLTEIGVDTMVPVFSERSVVYWTPQKVNHNLQRLRAISTQAAAQSRRLWLPKIAEPISFRQVITDFQGICSMAEVGADGELSLERPVVIIGPEGGWSEDELASELPMVGLSAQVLRSETAAIVAGALLCKLRNNT